MLFLEGSSRALGLYRGAGGTVVQEAIQPAALGVWGGNCMFSGSVLLGNQAKGTREWRSHGHPCHWACEMSKGPQSPRERESSILGVEIFWCYVVSRKCQK